MTLLPSLPITIPLAGAVLCMLARRNITAQKMITVVTSAFILLTSLFIMAQTRDGTIAVLNVGGWQAPFGITLAIDMLSSVMLLLVGLLAVGVTVYSCFDLDESRMKFGFFPLMLILLMGVNGAFVTGDLFNLYVWFEVLLTASFILLALGGERPQLEGSIKYVALNLLSSALFLAGIGILYGMAGTLNMAELAHVVQQGERGGLVTMVAVMFMIAFGIKCGMFPLYFWLPASYPTPPAAVTALFSGLLTKVGVYSLIRVFTLIFSTDPEFLHGLILAGAGLTMLSGVLAAAAQYEMRKILSVHIVSQIGYIVMGLGLFTKLALTGTIVYLAHVIIVKTNLFLVSGAIQRLKGTNDLHKLGGLYKERPGLSILFIISAMSLAGIPPLSGFFAKLTLIIAGLRMESWLIVAVALGVSLLTLYSMTKIWSYVFWKPAPEPLPDLNPLPKGKWFLFLLPMIGYTVITIAIGIFAGPIFDYADVAAGQLMNPQGYIDAVLGGGALMQLFVTNILISMLWALLTGKMTIGNIVLGFVLGYFALVILYPGAGKNASYFKKTLQLIRFTIFFTKELIVSSWRVAIDVVKPLPLMRPGVVGIPLDAETDLEITMLANVISLTPGTLSLDVSKDRKTLYIHAMYVVNPDDLRREIKDGLERRLLELLR